MDVQRRLQDCSADKASFIITLCVLLIIIVVFLGIVIYAVLFVERVIDVVFLAFYNTNECVPTPEKCNYVDFQPVLPTVFPDDSFSTEIALLGCQITSNLEWLAVNNYDYHIPPGLVFAGALQGCPNCDYRRGGYKDADDTIPLGYMLIDPATRTLYLSYRGAVTATDWQYAYAFDEVLISQSATWYDREKLGLTGTSSRPFACSGTIAVHSGFAFLFQSIAADLIELIAENRNNVDRLVIYGHSLGGPLASLSGGFLAFESFLFPKPIYIYTYGKPRVGNPGYAACMNAIYGRRYWRLENVADVIPAIPISSSPNFSNPNQPWLYDQDGQLFNYQLNWGSQTLSVCKPHSQPNLIGCTQHNLNNYTTGTLLTSGMEERVIGLI